MKLKTASPLVPALNTLHEINSNFLKIEEKFREVSSEGNRIDPKEAREIIKQLIFSLTLNIQIAEKEDLTQREIQVALKDARRIFALSSFVRHLQSWPHGYMGDFEAINLIMDNGEYSKSPLGRLIGECVLETPIAQQHREKVKIQAALIAETCRKKEGAIIVSVAAGSSRDIESIQATIEETKARVYLIDSDPDAIADSLKRLKKIQGQIITNCMNVFRLPKLLNDLREEGDCPDLVFAGGLFDYLDCEHAERFVKSVSSRLPNGTFMFTNIVRGNAFRPLIETMADWTLVERSEEDMNALLDLFGREHKSLEKDPTHLAWIAKVW